MDNRGDNNRKIGLDEVKFIPFWDALIDSDETKVGLEREHFVELCDDFYAKAKVKRNALEQQISKLEDDISILTSCYLILVGGQDEEILEIIKSHDIEYFDDPNVIIDRVKVLEKKHKMLATQRPPQREEERTTGYEVLANLAMGLEFGLNFKEVTVLEYIGYRNALNAKAEAIKQSQKKKK